MDDATRSPDDVPGHLESIEAGLADLVGELTHAVLTLFRARGIPLAEQLTRLRRDPFEVVDLFVVTLRALADGLEDPDPNWLSG